MLMVAAATAFAFLLHGFNRRCYFKGHNPRRNCNDTITHYHNKTGDEFAQTGNRGYISEPYCCESCDCPVDPRGDAGEPAGFTFDEVHQGSDNYYHHEDGKKKHKDFIPAGSKGINNDTSFPGVTCNFQDTEDSEQTEGTDHCESHCTGEEQVEVSWDNGHEVNNPVKTENIPEWLWMGPDPCYVFDSEYYCDNPFRRIQDAMEL